MKKLKESAHDVWVMSILIAIGAFCWWLLTGNTAAGIVAILAVVYYAAYGVATKQFCRHAAAKYIETLGGARLQARNVDYRTPHLHHCPTCGYVVFLAEKRNE